MRTRKAAAWTRLDNAAKIFPSTSSKSDPKVFRFACQLFEEIDPAILQDALDQTIAVFPHFRAVLRRGLFWYFLEQRELPAIVHAEILPPCFPIYDPVQKGLLFRVSYYRKRIHVEVYHALTDGTGALHFLRTLVYHYLLLRHGDALGDLPPLSYDASLTQRADDSFQKYYAPGEKKKTEKTPAACRIRMERLPDYGMRVIEGVLPAAQTIAAAKGFGATITSFLTAVLILSIYKELPLRERKKPISIAIPVNLRNYFESESSRNFFGLFRASCRLSDGDTLPDLLAAVSDCFRRELTAERLTRRMNDLAALEHNPVIRVIPLFLKDPVLRFFNWRSAKGETSSFSNLGRVEMPAQLAPYIDLFTVFISASRMQLCACSYGDKLAVSFTSPNVSADIEKRFFRTLTELGLPVLINSTREEAKP